MCEATRPEATVDTSVEIPEADTSSATPTYVAVAVPVPMPEALTYRLPDSLRHAAQPGCRVEVPLGPRKLRGIVLEVGIEAPRGFKTKDVGAVLDGAPVLTSDLLALARFTAGYYLAPIGEVLRSFVPSKLPPWGHRRVSLTNAGALAPPRDPEEARLVEYLLAHPRSRLADLQRDLDLPDLAARLDALKRLGRMSMEEPGRRGTRYVKAVELRPLEPEARDTAIGRSPQGRAVVGYLEALGRPATLGEIGRTVGCGPSVTRRLIERGVLRQFTQPERLSLDRHRLHGQEEERPEIVLRPDQATAVTALEEALADGGYAPFLLHGMTGSGKTEVYLRAVETALAADRTAILLVPEIALVPALAETASARFGSDLAILHSNLSASERAQEWERLRRGSARVVLGPRSALFAPLENLGLIVVDEEHDTSYKQDAAPRYNGRDLALWRARENSAVVVLASATPSLESRHNADVGKLGPLFLTSRSGTARLPEGILVDLGQEKASRRPGEVYFSPVLCGEIEATLAAGDQVILLRNRRGYSPVLLCRACGEDFRCEDCGLPQTFHRRQARLTCHYCARERPVPPFCPACKEEALDPIGAGTERVEEEVAELFPEATVDVLDADVSSRVGGAAAVLERFGSGQTQILIGTQMVSKGHHFPRVALAAVLFADTYLRFPDFRAVERTYALLTQLAGRAGRGERPGRVVIQTFFPQHYAIRAALDHDDAAFAEEEMQFRRTYHYPPFSRMVQLLVRHKERGKAEAAVRDLARRVMAHPLAADVRITGPAVAPLERLRGKWRYQLLLRSPSSTRLRKLTRQVTEGIKTDLTVDVDPYELM